MVLGRVGRGTQDFPAEKLHVQDRVDDGLCTSQPTHIFSITLTLGVRFGTFGIAEARAFGAGIVNRVCIGIRIIELW